MALSNFFRINLPYGIRGNNTKGWFAFNREYKPIGFNNYDHVEFDAYPIYTKYQRLTKKKMIELNDNDEGSDHIIKVGENEFLIFLYNDATIPCVNKTCWDRYFKKIRTLSMLKRKEK